MPYSIFAEKNGNFFPSLVFTQGNFVLCFSTVFVCLVGNPYTVVAISKGEGEAFTKQFFKAILRGAFRKSPRISLAPSCLKTGLFRLNYE